MSNRIGAASLGLFVLLAAGCQLFSSGSASKSDGPLIGANEAYHLGYTPRWSASIGMTRSDRLAYTVILGDLIVTVQRGTNLVSAVGLNDGIVRWQTVVGSPADAIFEPVRVGERILVNSETHLYGLAVDTGRLVSDAALAATTVDQPAVMDQLLIFGGLNGRIFAHDSISNQVTWEQDMSSGIVVRPVASGLNVFVTDSNGVYAMFQGATGEPQWKGRTYGRNSAIPRVSSLGVFIASEDQTLYAINRSTGHDRWKYRAGAPLKQSPTLIDNTLFLPEPGVGLIAMDAINKKVLWNFSAAAEPVLQNKGRLYINEFTRITAVDPNTGKTIVQAPVLPLRTVLAGPGAAMILITQNGRLMRIDPTVQ